VFQVHQRYTQRTEDEEKKREDTGEKAFPLGERGEGATRHRGHHFMSIVLLSAGSGKKTVVSYGRGGTDPRLKGWGKKNQMGEGWWGGLPGMSTINQIEAGGVLKKTPRPASMHLTELGWNEKGVPKEGFSHTQGFQRPGLNNLGRKMETLRMKRSLGQNAVHLLGVDACPGNQG